jgi:hypothetical protein
MPYIGNVPAEAYSQVSYQDLTGGSGTSFTLDYPVGSAGEIEVFVNNVRQEPTVAYTVSGTSLTMTGSIAATDDFYVVFQSKAQQTIGIPEKQSDGTYLFPNAVDVTGTVTSDGLTVDGDVTFYEDTGTTAKFFWDASAERLELGDSVSLRGGSSSRMVLAETTAAAINWLEIQSSTTGRTGVIFSDGGTGNYGLIDYDHTDDHLKILTASTERMRIDSSGDVDIGSTGGGAKLAVAGAVGTQNGSAAAPSHTFYGDNDSGMFRVAADTLGFSTAGAERMRLTSTGGLLVHKTSPDQAVEGMEFAASNYLLCTKSGGTTAYFNRTTSDGAIAELRKNGSTVGIIGTYGSTTFIQSGASASHAGLLFNTSMVEPARANGTSGSDPRRDNVLDLGSPSYRFDDVYATNGTIQTSDANEKQQIAVLTDAEIAAAKRISAGFKTFKWNDAVEAKGDNARTHTGVIAQEVQTALEAEGLDAGNYAFWMSNTWWETQTEVPAVAEELDEDGNVITEAKEAYTRTDIYNTLEEAPAGATERTRLGIRYPELLAFIGAATEQRLTSIEARLEALETA